MLVIILLGIALKYSNLYTGSWLLVKLLLLLKTAQLEVCWIDLHRNSAFKSRHVHDSFRNHTMSPLTRASLVYYLTFAY